MCCRLNAGGGKKDPWTCEELGQGGIAVVWGNCAAGCSGNAGEERSVQGGRGGEEGGIFSYMFSFSSIRR